MTTAHRYIVSGPAIPASASPISQAVVAGSTCYVSGQLSTDRDGRFKPGSVGEQTQLALLNLFAALEAAGYGRDDVVFVEIALIDLGDLPIVNVVYSEFFDEARRPARTVFQAAALPHGGKVKVHGVAIRHEQRGS